MVDKSIEPSRYRTFAAWLKAVVDSGHKQTELAEVAKTTPQMFSKWLKGSTPKPMHVFRLARRFDLQYMELHQLAENIRIFEPEPEPTTHTTKSEMGARLGRKWEELDEPARTAVFDLVETISAQQRALAARKSET